MLLGGDQTDATPTVSFFFDQEMKHEITEDYPFGRVCVYSTPSPLHPDSNEDVAVVVPLDERRAVFAVADGAGGHADGRRASHMAIATLTGVVQERLEAGNSLREAILQGFDRANERVQESVEGSACTMVAVELDDGGVRSYHVGDSACLVFGGGGARKLLTTAHSPVGYALEAGVLDEQEAMSHQYRHLVSNMLGAPSMHVEISSRVPLRVRDTVVVASDGLFDNLHIGEIVELLRKGPLDASLRRTVGECRRRMCEPQVGEPSKPDDLTVVGFRPVPPESAGSTTRQSA